MHKRSVQTESANIYIMHNIIIYYLLIYQYEHTTNTRAYKDFVRSFVINNIVKFNISAFHEISDNLTTY